MKPILQNRWKLINCKDGTYLNYYGDFINEKYPKKNIKLDNEKLVNIICEFNGNKTLEDIIESYKCHDEYSQIWNQLQNLIKDNIVVDIKKFKKPVTDKEKRTCTKCVNNNHVIEDLEFDEEGVCDYCRFYEKQKNNSYVNSFTGLTDDDIKSILVGNNSRFDVMVLYTGGKDSSFLLWYLAKKLKLRVLAATWIMPFMQDSARENIYSAMKKLPNVEFIQQAVPWNELKEIMKLSFMTKGLPCICHFMAKLLFYPVAIRENIPLIVDGVEQVQTIFFGLGSKNNQLNNKPIVTERDRTFAELTNILRSEPFLKKVQKPNKNNPFYTFNGENITFLSNIQYIMSALLDNNKPIPIIKHLANSVGSYTWNEVKTILEKELDWKMPEGQATLLHTSCKIETLMDYTQMRRYQKYETAESPESILQISAAIYFNYITREQGFKELEGRYYFSEPECLKIVECQLGLTRDEIQQVYNYK